MSKPQLETFTKLQALKDEIASKSEQVREITEKLIKTHGEGRFDYEIEDIEGYSYVKYELTDNLEKMKRGEPVLTHSFVKTAELKQTFLKRIPESLKKG